MRFPCLLVALALCGCRTRPYPDVESAPPDLSDGDLGVPDLAVPGHCGDGVVDPGEECDDGNLDDGDACLSTCKKARCGDGVVWRDNEGCDDGNQNNNDGCKNNCSLPSCGNMLVEPPEQCDDGNLDDSDDCLSTCINAHCGDGALHVGFEECDDGNSSNTDACVMCMNARCGDGFVETGVEGCDDGNQIDDDFCDNQCRPPVCGDGKRAGAEQCDNGAANGNRPAFLVTQPSGLAIGTNPLIQNRTSAAFYNYFSASSHTGFEAVNESRIYLYVDAGTGRLSLILTHGIDFDTTGIVQPPSAVNMDISGLPAGFKIDLSDDPGEFTATGASTAAGRWTFNQNSDGGILGGLAFPGVWKVTVNASFMAGLTTWAWVRDDLARIPLTMGQTITIEAFDQTTACRTDCTIPRCGDHILDGGEVCDDGNNIGGDGCAADCKSLR